ncbi:sulfite exporter TauE/SafE family protein [Georgenia sp. SYP-B2076]|uniref:sulfite exporter TauE/SafE family protein n=1 Tax=Georgenia sp. SYP-B2076 TaxID=2495881 RepID=UPI000F8E42A5|nr:sulfite exporter TauE/SafE family protein [Georgenia sp. SYP-B2076]
MTDGGLLVIALAVVFASCLQSSIGFGLGLLAAPVIALVDPTLLPGTLVLLATGVCILGAVRERADIDFRGTGWALLGRLPGTALGAVLVVVLPARGLALMLAVTVLGGVLLSVRGWRPTPTRGALVVAGAASGLMGTATSIGGPPMALVWQDSSGARLRGTMSAFFLAGSVASLVALVTVGAIDARTLRMAGVLVPAMLGGYLLSRFVNRRLDARRVRGVALVVSTLGALLVVVDQVL